MPSGSPVTEEEIHAMLVEGTTAGVIESHEHTMVCNTFSGQAAHPERRWQYEMRLGCVLRVDGPAGPRPSFDVPLLGAVMQLSRDKASATFNIDVHSGPSDARSEMAVLECLRWADASVMLLLVRVLQVGMGMGWVAGKHPANTG